LVAWTVLSFLALVFLADEWWQVLLAATSLGLAVAGIGFNIQHDGNHGSYASKSWGNRLASWTLDLIGGSSYMWRFKHNLFHHHYTNIDGVDDDLQAEPFLRLSPGQRRRWFHRFQHYYIWPLYAFIPAKWHWWDDFKQLVTGRINDQTIPRPRGWAFVGLIAGKIAFVGWALALPFFLHPPGIVLAVYAFVCLVTGVTLGTVFQLAHCVEEADFEPCPAGGQRLPRPWAEHQLATTVNFSPRSRLLTWYLGGLNFQVEHHLYPKISHVHYPAIAGVVQQTCEDLGVRHRSHPNIWGALASHIRHMKRLGTTGGRDA
jgi:linoleoyl-CoA desaturase